MSSPTPQPRFRQHIDGRLALLTTPATARPWYVVEPIFKMTQRWVTDADVHTEGWSEAVLVAPKAQLGIKHRDGAVFVPSIGVLLPHEAQRMVEGLLAALLEIANGGDPRGE